MKGVLVLMPLDGVTTFFLTKELNSILSGGRIEKIYQPERYGLLFKIRVSKVSYILNLSANPSDPHIHLSSETKSNPEVPPRFCAILRKYLSRSSIISIQSQGVERVITIKFLIYNELGDPSHVSLICEFMGRHSNIILTDNNNIILDSIIHVDFSISRIRQVLPSYVYQNPPSQNKLSFDEVKPLLENDNFFEDNIDSFAENYIVQKINGISPLLANELLFFSGIFSKTKVYNLSEIQKHTLSNTIINIIDSIQNEKIYPCVLFKDATMQNPTDFHALQISSFPNKKSYDNVIDAVNDYYLHKSSRVFIENKRNIFLKFLNKKINSIISIIDIHNQEIAESKNYNDYNKFGNLIYSNIYNIKEGESLIKVMDYEIDENLNIPLNPDLSPSANAQKYFNKFKKMKSKHKNATNFLKKEVSILDYLLSVKTSLLNANSKEDIKAIEEEFESVPILKEISKSKRKQKPSKLKKAEVKTSSKPRKYLSSDGFEIYIGRNNIQNDYITFSLASKWDIWMHIQNSPGAHTIIRRESERVTIPDSTLEEAAMLTAWHSRSEISKDVISIIDYCEVSNVTKRKMSSPGNVFFRNHRSINVNSTIPETVKIYD